MKLTPLDIKRHSFEKGFRGYDPAEVDGFLKQVADQFESLHEELRLAHERTRETEGKLQHYERVEMALQEALESAKASAQRSEEDASRRAAVIVEEAELRAQQILQDVERERFGMRQDLVRLSSRQAEVAARLRGFLMSELEVLSDFQGAPGGLIQMDEPLRLPAQSTSHADDAAGASADDALAQPLEAEGDGEPHVAPDDAGMSGDSGDEGSTLEEPGYGVETADLAPPVSAALSEPEPFERPSVPYDPAPIADALVDDPWDTPPYPAPEPPAPRVEISSRAGEDILPPDDSEVLGPPTPMSDDVPMSSGGWVTPSDANVAASEAERERIRRILEDLD